MLDADLQVLPERPAGETVEIAHDDDEAHVAARGGPLERGQQHVPVVLGRQLPVAANPMTSSGSPLNSMITYCSFRRIDGPIVSPISVTRSKKAANSENGRWRGLDVVVGTP